MSADPKNPFSLQGTGEYLWPSVQEAKAVLEPLPRIQRVSVLDGHFTDRLLRMWPAWRPIDHRDIEALFDELIHELLESRLEFAGALPEVEWTRFMHDLLRDAMHGEFDPQIAAVRFRKYLRLAGIPLDGLEADFLQSGTFLFLLEMAGRILERGHGPLLEETLADKARHKRFIAALDRPVLLIEPWEHQLAALQAWRDAGRKGILELATATGKTVIGLQAIEDIYREKEKPKVVVMAHSQALVDQWRREALQKLALPGMQIKGLDQLHNGGGVAFATVQGIASRLRQGKPVPQVDLAIVDEVHHYAGKAFGDAVKAVKAPMRLGLSATVEGERHEYLERVIGPILYTLTVKQAIETGLLPRFEWSVYPTPLEPDEAEEFRKIGKQISEKFPYVRKQAPAFVRKRWGEVDSLAKFFRVYERVRYMGRNGDLPQSWRELHSLVVSRRWIIHRSRPKIRDAIDLATTYGKDRKVVVFTMDIGTTQTIAGQLRSRGIEVFEAHSELKRRSATQAIDRFRNAPHGVLVSPKLLDEGVDIPDADVGINVASTKTRIQLVQRLGRILRRHEGKEPEFHHFLSVMPEETTVRSLDEVETVADMNWILDLSTIFGITPRVEHLSQSVERERLARIMRAGRDNWQDILEHDDFRVDGLDGTFQPARLVAAFSDDEARHLLGLWKKHGLPTSDGTLDETRWQAFTNEGREDVPIEGWWWIHTLFHDEPQTLLAALERQGGMRLDDATVPEREDVVDVRIDEHDRADTEQELPPEPQDLQAPGSETAAPDGDDDISDAPPLDAPVDDFQDASVRDDSHTERERARLAWEYHVEAVQAIRAVPRAADEMRWKEVVEIRCPNCLADIEVLDDQVPECGNCGHR